VRENVIYNHTCRKTHAGHSAAEARVVALEQSIGGSEGGDPDASKHKHIAAEAEVRQQLAEATRKLERLQSLYGDSSDASPDMQQLLERLRQKEEELEKLRLLDSQRAQVGGTVGSDFWCFSIMSF
jgi:E3 ubiquitin-protein ligase BRE1